MTVYQTFIIELLAILCGVAGFFLIMLLLLSKIERMDVDIITEAGVERKKYRVDGNKLIVRKEKKGSTGYKPTFSRKAILNYISGFPFKRLSQKVMIFEDAEECIEFDKPKVEKPTYDRKASENLFHANVIKSSGQTVQKVTIPVLVYMLLIGILIAQMLLFLVASGRLRIG